MYRLDLLLDLRREDAGIEAAVVIVDRIVGLEECRLLFLVALDVVLVEDTNVILLLVCFGGTVGLLVVGRIKQLFVLTHFAGVSHLGSAK